MAKKNEIAVRFGRNNKIAKENRIITPLYLQMGPYCYTGMINDRDNNVFSISWSKGVPEFVQEKTQEFIDLYTHFKNSIPTIDA